MRSNILLTYFALHLSIQLAGAASALTLLNFQALTVTVPIPCAIAYDRSIPSCTKDDFSSGAVCSSGCVSGLNQIALSVNAACNHVIVDGATLLGRIFQGQIIQALCPNNGKTTPKASSTPPAQTAPTKQTTSTPPSTSASSDAQSSTPTTAAASSSSTPDASGTTTTSSSSTATSGTSDPIQNTATSSSASAVQTAAPATSPGSGKKAGLTVQQQQIMAMSHSGGGSPFDIIGYTAAASQSMPCGAPLLWTVGTLVCIAMVLQ